MAAIASFPPVLVGLVLFLVASDGLPSRPRYIECANNIECNPWECCRLGMGRFSLPTCVARPEKGEACRPAGPTNTSVVYPDGAQVWLSEVYLVVCPCARGLECDQDHLRCHDPAVHSEFNYL